MGVYFYIKADGETLFQAQALVSCGRSSFAGSVALAVGMILCEGVFYHLSSFFPLLLSLSTECWQSSAEGMPLLGDRPARISDGLFCSLWGGNSGGVFRPLAQLHAPHRGGREAPAALLGSNLRPASEKPLGQPLPALSPSASPLPRTECSSLQKPPALYKIRSGQRNARMRK